MSDYKDTLNLPQTAFAMKANLPNREPEILSYWEEIDLYGLLKEEGKTKEKFILHDLLLTQTIPCCTMHLVLVPQSLMLFFQ